MDNLDSTKQKSITLVQKINVLRAAVMGANDGIISVAGIVLGVAGAASSSFAILISGLAGMLAGTISMAMGEYVSVHSQSDAEVAAVVREKKILDTDYQKEFLFIKNKLLKAGISEELSHKATKEMMDRDPLKSIVREKYGFELKSESFVKLLLVEKGIFFVPGSCFDKEYYFRLGLAQDSFLFKNGLSELTNFVDEHLIS